MNGPKYKLSADGGVEFAGRFIDNQFHRDKRIIVRSLNKSYILVRAGVVNRLFGGERNQEDIELFIKIIIESNNLLKEKYNAKFYVVFWPLGEKDSDYVINKLKENGINVIIVDHIFMRYKDAREKYTIPGDAHPTKLAYERIAKYLLENLN